MSFISVIASLLLLFSQLKFAQAHRDLGIMVYERLTWSHHHNYISQKAYHSLHLLFRTVYSTASISLKKHLYLVLVRSQLVYCSQLWRPRLISGTLKKPRKDSMQSYQLYITWLHFWVFQSPKFHFFCELEYYVSYTANTLKANFNRSSHSCHFYSNRIVRLWNSLPAVDLSLSFANLKTTLRKLITYTVKKRVLR